MKRKYQAILFFLVLYLCITPLVIKAQDTTNQPEPNDNGSKNMTLNFRGADLDTVLDYLSKAAGFVINKEADVTGTVDVWSHQPLSADEAINLLNTILHERGFAAIRSGRTLTIVNRDIAKQKNIPVYTGNNPDEIPTTDEMVTQIIPVRYTDAIALIDNLQPLLASYATMSSNESSNAVIITDTQANIQRIVKIIRALDTSISSISSVHVFALSHTDASDAAEIVTELFESNEGQSDNGRGRPPFFGRGGRDRDDNDAPSSEARRAASRVVAVADENTNSLIVSAPEEYMPVIADLVRQIDTLIEDITEIRVFKLNYADAYEMAEQIEELFPDDSTESENQFFPRFGRGGPPMPSQQQQNSSERQLQQTTVRAVADPRTNSVIVFAANTTMNEIARMVDQLDRDSSKKQNVYVYRLEYADVDNVAEILRNIFENQTTTINRNNTTTNQNTLSNRQVETQSIDSGFNR